MDPYIGEIRPFANSFYPDGWLPCTGLRVSIVQYQALFSVISSIYGPSDFKTYFTLPDLQASAIVGTGTSSQGSTFIVGDKYGDETVQLTNANLPAHSHIFNGVTGSGPSAQSTADIQGTSYLTNFFYTPASGAQSGAPAYLDQSENPVTLNPGSILPEGGIGAHNNMSPYLVIGYYICATEGYYPVRP